MGLEIKPCPFCGDAWVYASVGDYGSGYEVCGYRMTCKCGYAWEMIPWRDTEGEVIEKWNRFVERRGMKGNRNETD